MIKKFILTQSQYQTEDPVILDNRYQELKDSASNRSF
jgi:hypothetical protein